jgi:hypothetical protein
MVLGRFEFFDVQIGFILVPQGRSENSPAIYRWEYPNIKLPVS